MQFSMIFEAQLANPTREREHQTIQDCLEQAVFAEQMGFDRIWAVEHHGLLRYAHMSAPEIFLSYVAARTTRIRIGHGVVRMPFAYNHPVRAAERAAMLDQLSGGRLDLGAGRGATAQEMALFGVDPEETYPQMEEALRLIGKVWQPDAIDDFHWQGRQLSIEPPDPKVPLRVVPRPLQLPHPPLYLACTKDDTVRLAADYGIGALVLGFAGAEEIGRLNDIYRKAIASRTGEHFVSTEVNDHFSALCPTIVLDDGEQALGHGARGQRFFAEAISHWYLNGAPINEDTEDEDNIAGLEARREAVKAKLHEADIPYKPNSSNAWDVNHAYGDAQRAIAYVERLQDAGADEIMCLIQMGLVPQEVCMETIRQWGETVIPHFRDR